MGYKKYSDTASAWEIIRQIKESKITGNTAYRELETIKGEWRGTDLVDEAEYLINTMFSEYKYK
ncbi:MAG: hypothetical protein HDQ98_03430 [Lachnospiraceae bacterium]|nr:hypothetical protein [Lachnospiraceae bacterium]